ncbi:hypothetical protein KUCAC02_020498, partial [Chaenocephalus aceratus]
AGLKEENPQRLSELFKPLQPHLEDKPPPASKEEAQRSAGLKEEHPQRLSELFKPLQPHLEDKPPPASKEEAQR